ncbi:S-adenosyl-L-methionine-dependent methyltransferase [Xylaria telfairii]|nr:S-adenosyl-L-methionine-dependent methyltransferase [Xylaria telfairii]
MPANKPNGVSHTASTMPLEELSWSITRNGSIISHHLAASSHPQPSFKSDAPSTLLPKDSPESVVQARENLISACLELLHLAIGPSDFLPNLATSYQYISCLSWLCKYGIFHLVPLDGAISYDELAAGAHVPAQRLKSVIRMAMTTGLFRELGDGTTVGHTATSALLARDADVHAYAAYMCARSVPGAMHMAAAHERWGPDSTRTYETAFNVAFDTDLPFFEYLAKDKVWMGEFAGYMRNMRSSEGVDLKHLISGFRWQDLPNGGTVVDVGGSTGTSAVALAKTFSHLSFVVQDLPPNPENGQKAVSESLPPDVASRLTFLPHDFTNPQPIQGADAYLLRMILHDWPDAEAIKILCHLVTAMDEVKSRLLIMDVVLPRAGSVPVSVERLARVKDLTMIQAFNSKERDLDDWTGLLHAADPRLRIAGRIQPPGSSMDILEVVLEP